MAVKHWRQPIPPEESPDPEENVLFWWLDDWISTQNYSHFLFLYLRRLWEHLWLLQSVRLSVHAGLPGVSGHMWHGDKEQGDSAEDEQHEGGAGTGERPRVVVFNPNGLVTVNHSLDWLTHYLNRDDDAKACMDQRGCVVCTHSGQKNNTRMLISVINWKQLNFLSHVWPAKAKNIPAGRSR